MSARDGRARTWLWLVAAMLTLPGVAVVAAWWAQPRLERYIETSLEAELEAASGGSADVGRVSLSLRDAMGTIEGITIASPDESDGEVLEIDSIELRLSPDSLTSDTLVVREVSVTGARLNVRQRGGSSNLNAILEHMRAEDDVPATAESARRIIIDRFLLDDAVLVVSSDAFDEPQTVTLEPLILSGLGRGPDGMSFDEAADAILGEIVLDARKATGRQVSQAAGEAVGERVQDEARQRIDKLLE